MNCLWRWTALLDVVLVTAKKIKCFIQRIQWWTEKTAHSYNLLRRKCLLSWGSLCVLDALRIHMHKQHIYIYTAQKYLVAQTLSRCIYTIIWWVSERVLALTDGTETHGKIHRVWAHAKHNHTVWRLQWKRVKQHQTANERSLDIRLWSFTCKLMFSNNN